MNGICQLLFVLILAGSGVYSLGKVDCRNKGCFYDFNMYCLKSGKIVFSDCKLKRAVCLYGEEEAPLNVCIKLVNTKYG